MESKPMPGGGRRRGPFEAAVLAGLLVVGAVVFLAGIGWGLPSHAVDPFLFGDRPVWSGREIGKLAGEGVEDPARAADVSSRPVDRRGGAVVVNATDPDRARIVRRYRLMSYQPDEFTTFAALGRMKPARGDLDPRMYKYGGLWVYPVGALLKAASMARWVRLTPDMTFYLDHPEAFGRFYVVARAYSAGWGLIGVAVVFFLVRRICGSISAAACAAMCFMLMPVVVNAAHEAKPHLAGTVLMLLTVAAGARFAQSGSRPAAWSAAALAGLAVGMVPSALPALLVLPAMQLLRGRFRDGPVETGTPGRAGSGTRWVRDAVGFLVVAGCVYCLTNPFVVVNLVRDRAVLRSNFGNSSAFYHAGGSALPNAVRLIGWGASFVPAAAGIVGGIALAVRAGRVRPADRREARRQSTGLLLAVPTVAAGIVFVVFAAGQPADYARFALPFDVFLLIEAVVAVATFVRPAVLRAACYLVLVGTTGWMGMAYVRGFVRDGGAHTTRLAAAERIRDRMRSGNGLLASRLEPAPWSLPPADLFRWKIVLPPVGWPPDRPYPGAQVTVSPTDWPHGKPARLSSTPISWASKTFAIEPAAQKGG